MIFFTLQKKLRELVTSNCTLLWLEGAKHERVLKIKLTGNKVILNLSNETTRVIAFERYVCTSVGLQFWFQGKPGVLYKWEQVSKSDHYDQILREQTLPEDDPTPPPNVAA
ncbi:hypothetical protein [Fluviispira multicolorata]|uniref:Uncharacterized protein n=1 Tax=Fluviispira multicolorata TaxID=2654512 RepID=A0A833N2A6_9BACT|nr:hypothetical protein [Fluviispira multicolorata]KAB8027967.1 hypothetical protein GCL57_13005 [Fluviispira multicolorata]